MAECKALTGSAAKGLMLHAICQCPQFAKCAAQFRNRARAVCNVWRKLDPNLNPNWPTLTDPDPNPNPSPSQIAQRILQIAHTHKLRATK